MNTGRRGFLGGLITLPFLAKAATVAPPAPAPPVAVAPEPDLAPQRFAHRASSQNVGAISAGGDLPVSTPITYQAWFNPTTEPVVVAVDGHLGAIPPGESRYRNRRGYWVSCPNPRKRRA